MRMSVVLVGCASIIIGIMISCGGVAPEEVPGVYTMRSPYGVEILRLEATGKYTQTILLDTDTAACTCSGTWELSDDSTEVFLMDALCVTDIYGQLNPTPCELVKGRKAAGIITKVQGSVWLRGDVNYAWRIYKRL